MYATMLTSENTMVTYTILGHYNPLLLEGWSNFIRIGELVTESSTMDLVDKEWTETPSSNDKDSGPAIK